MAKLLDDGICLLQRHSYAREGADIPPLMSALPEEETLMDFVSQVDGASNLDQ